MNNKLYIGAEKILKTIYTNEIQPTKSLELLMYSPKLDKITGYSSLYLNKIIKELCKKKYIERIAIGYSEKGNYNKCFDNLGTYKKTKDCLKITRAGTNYLKKVNQVGTKESEKKRRMRDSVVKEERKRRAIYTNAFFCKVKELGTEEIEIKYIDAKEKKEELENKTIKGSKFFGILECKKGTDTKNIAIYNTGKFITSINEKTESNLSKLLGTGIMETQEKILLAENPYVIRASIEITNEREKVTEKQEKKIAKTIITDEKNNRIYYHNLDIGGIKELEIYKIPNRKEYWNYIFTKKEETKEYINEESIKNAELFEYTAETKEKIIYIGYEQELGEIRAIKEIIKHTKKELLIICLREQKRNYEILLSENINKIKFIETEDVYGNT